MRRRLCDGTFRWKITDRSDESIAASCESLNKARILGGVAESLPDFIDGCAQRMVEVDDRILTPESKLKFLTRDDLAGAFDQGGQDFERLALQLDAKACLPQFACLKINFVKAEGESRIGNRGWHRIRNRCVIDFITRHTDLLADD